jgi:MoaA/NifB/PqqE/SkfB family radical SAM enzyme
VANIGYIQVVRHCNHFCGFCSNPTTPYTHDFESMKVLVDDFVQREYFGVILTGGEPTLHPELPRITAYAREQGLHVRIITNGHRLADAAFAQALAEAGLQLAHVSVYSIRPDVEARLRGTDDTLGRAFRAVENAHRFGIEVNINCVINKLNADHLDESIEYWIDNHPYVRHFIWNNLDPSMGRAEVNQEQFTPRLADFKASLHRAMSLLHTSGRTFRVEKVPLCYMTAFAWASTETRKIVKLEERIVHFLDDKQTVRQRDWGHLYADVCEACTLRSICGGLFDRGGAYSTDELNPVFVNRDHIVRQIIFDPTDPSRRFSDFEQWRREFDEMLPDGPAPSNASASDGPPRAAADGPAVGRVTERGVRLYGAKRKAEARRASKTGVNMELSEESDSSKPPR